MLTINLTLATRASIHDAAADLAPRLRARCTRASDSSVQQYALPERHYAAEFLLRDGLHLHSVLRAGHSVRFGPSAQREEFVLLINNKQAPQPQAAQGTEAPPSSLPLSPKASQLGSPSEEARCVR
ncbi:hypothetical protein [Allokutzneria sp. NRRL B-24872]|uniref:hypothetical protein n=1 Tax=Allokutzneria sp. NRRL B-24872 TaxID=1137961 RepID=UPI000A3BA80D|nr:hypothetical protein [Allokutzneria sp. NRRL B-24872]